MKPSFQLTFGLPAIRFFTIAGVFASITVMACNTVLYSYGGDVSVWPQWAINLSYWAGSIVLAFAALGFVPTYFTIRPVGRLWAVIICACFGYFVALGSAGHGSISPYYNILQALEISPNEPILQQLATPIETYYNVLMLVCISALFIGSILFSIMVFFKKTIYPKWMSFWNMFIITLIIFIIGDLQILLKWRELS